MGMKNGNIDFDGLPRASDTAKHSAGTTNLGTGGPGRPTTVEIWLATELLQVSLNPDCRHVTPGVQ